MKAGAILTAAILVLVYALASGAWAINDYRNHEEVKQEFARQGITYLSMRTDSGKAIRLDVRKMASYYERHDAKVGAISLACLIGSNILFWCRSRVVKPVNRN